MQKNHHILTQFALFFALGLTAQAQTFVVPSDAPYWTRQSANIKYIYAKDASAHLPEVDHYMSYFRSQYDRSFAWALDEQVKLVLTSTQNQVTNGFATPIPFLMTFHYPLGVEMLDHFAEDSFLFALTSHETAHLYQLSSKSSTSSAIKSILGNSPMVMIPFFPIPIFVFPNAFLPNAIVEGNAVLNESVVKRGGRLWSGEVRAEVLGQVKAGKSGPKRLFNQVVDVPLSEKYHYGGYFMAFLAEKFGLERTNQFFRHHANREFWPFNINKSFREAFGQSYTALMFEADQRLKKMGASLQPASGQSVAQTIRRPHFNHDQQKIYFIQNPDGRTENQLFTFEKTSKNMTTQNTDIPSGRAFFLDGEYWVTHSTQVDPTHIQYGLYGSGLKPKAGSMDMVWMDWRAGHRLGVDAKTSYARNQLIKDGILLDQTAGSAVLDSEGRAYYFKQVGDERVLHRDAQPLFRFKGYYGIVMEVNEKGDVVFVASSELGSTAYVWQKGQILRLFEADNVVEVRHISQDDYLVAAETGSGFDIQILNANPRAGPPAFNILPLQQTEAPAFNPDQTKNQLSHLDHEQEYTPLSQLRYSSGQVALSNNSYAASALFVDPLLWNILGLGVLLGTTNGGQAYYVHQRYRLGYALQLNYLSEAQTDSLTNVTTYKNSGGAFLGLHYQLFKWRRWSGQLDFGPTWIQESDVAIQNQKRYGLLTQAQFSYARMNGVLAYDLYRYFGLQLSQHTQFSASEDKKVDSANTVEVKASADVYRQTYLLASAQMGWSEINSLRRSSTLGEEILPTKLGSGEAKQLMEWSLGFKQAIDWSYYFMRFPISLRRLAPYALIREVTTKEHETNFEPGWQREVLLGLETELLLLGQMPVRVSAGESHLYKSNKWERDWTFSLRYKKDF